jgi:hypothetical protein
MQCIFKAILFDDSAEVVSLKKLLLQVTEDARLRKMHLLVDVIASRPGKHRPGRPSTAPFTALHGVAMLKVCVM